jgi:hypothetical protein
MAVPTHFKFSFRGRFNNTPEIWSFGCHFDRIVVAGPDADLSNIDEGAVTAALTTLIEGPSDAAISTNVKVVDWRAYVIGTDGLMEGNPLFVDLSTEDIGGAAGNRYPPQIAAVVTLVADNRGPARFGRMYLPGPAEAIANDMRLSETSAAGYAESVTDFLKAVSSAIDLPGTIESAGACNISKRGGSEGTIQSIDHVEVGRVLDTLRTRRNNLLEERHVHGQIDW